MINELKGYLLYKAFRKAKHIFTLSEKVKTESRILYNKKAVIIRGAYSDSIFNYKPKKDLRKELNLKDKRIIFTIGRLDKHKRVDLCIRAFNILRYNIHDAILLIGGKGPELENLQLLVKELNLDKHIIFLGFIPEEDLLDYYKMCDIFTTMDPADFDITAFVALALGKKIVIPRIMEVDDEFIKNNQSFKTPPDVSEIAKTLELALKTNIENWNDEEILKYYTWSSCFNRLLNEINGGVR